MAAQSKVSSENPLIPRQELFGNPEKANPQISPNGKMLAWIAPYEGVLNVWVKSLAEDKDDSRVITNDKKQGIQYFVWQQDSANILYVQDKNGDENEHIYQTNLKNKSTKDLTPFKEIKAEVLAIDPNHPNEILIGLNRRDPKVHDVYALNLSDASLNLLEQNPGNIADWVIDNNFQVRGASIVKDDGGTEILIRNSAGEWKSFYECGPDDTCSIMGFTPDNQAAWIDSSIGANAERLLEIDLSSGKSKIIAENQQFDISHIITHPISNKLEAVEFIGERANWQIIDESVKADYEFLAKVRDGDFTVTSRDNQDRNWIVVYVVDDGPVYFYLYDRHKHKADKLFTSRPKLEKYKLAKMKPISFTARDGMKIYAYLTLPPHLEPKNLPLILNVHGGPYARDTWGWDSEAQWLANRGYAVLQINFRGSTGYGKDYLNAGDRQWAAKMHDDLLDGKNWAVQNGYADSSKVGIYGGSYGGYATLVGLAFTPEEFACGVDIVGPSNLVTLLQSIPPYWLPARAIFDKRLGKLETEQEFLKSRSPLFKADKITKPLLIAHGSNDPRVKQAESDQIVKTMREHNLPVEYLVFPDEGHGFDRPENRLKFYAAAESFLAKYLGGRVEPVSAEEDFASLLK